MMNKWNTLFSSVGLQLLENPIRVHNQRKTGLKAVHVLWTMPFFDSYPNHQFSLNRWELYVCALSILSWKRNNGPVLLVTDSKGESYIRESGLDQLYDDIIPFLKLNSYALNPKKYWAAGKIIALEAVSAPCVIMDMDFIFYDCFQMEDAELVASHPECLNPDIYPEFSWFSMKDAYQFPEDWNQDVLPVNTSFLYFQNENFKQEYAYQSLRFMRMERNSPDINERCMVFAEQRILSLMAHQKKLKFKTLINNKDEHQAQFTHVWSMKHAINMDEDLQNHLIQMCKDRIIELMGRDDSKALFRRLDDM